MPQGRPRKPTSLRILEGKRGHNPLPKGEPQPRVGNPEMPEAVAVEAEAAKMWDYMLDIMGAVPGWVTYDMLRMLSDYALLYARDVRLNAYLHKNGETYESEYTVKDEHDREVLVRKRSRHPETIILKEVLTEIRQLESAMGIGPVFKARVDLSGAKAELPDVLEG